MGNDYKAYQNLVADTIAAKINCTVTASTGTGRNKNIYVTADMMDSAALQQISSEVTKALQDTKGRNFDKIGLTVERGELVTALLNTCIGLEKRYDRVARVARHLSRLEWMTYSGNTLDQRIRVVGDANYG